MDEQKTRELALEMGEEGSFMYSHAMCILTKMAEWKEKEMVERTIKILKEILIFDSDGHVHNDICENDFITDLQQRLILKNN